MGRRCFGSGGPLFFLAFCTRLAIHLIELLADMPGGPENRDQEPRDKLIQEV